MKRPRLKIDINDPRMNEIVKIINFSEINWEVNDNWYIVDASNTDEMSKDILSKVMKIAVEYRLE